MFISLLHYLNLIQITNIYQNVKTDSASSFRGLATLRMRRRERLNMLLKCVLPFKGRKLVFYNVHHELVMSRFRSSSNTHRRT